MAYVRRMRHLLPVLVAMFACGAPPDAVPPRPEPPPPRAAPVTITVVPPKAGDVRVRTVETSALAEEEYRTRTRTSFRAEYELREEVLAVERANRIVRVTVVRADENVEVGDERSGGPDLHGPYRVTVHAPGHEPAVTVTLDDGSEAPFSEAKKLAELFELEGGAPHELVDIVMKRPLRAGESVRMTKVPSFLHSGADGVLDDVLVTLANVDSDLATYTADVTIDHAEARYTRRVTARHTITLDVVTGRVLELRETTRWRTERRKGAGYTHPRRNTGQATLVMKLAYR